MYVDVHVHVWEPLKFNYDLKRCGAEKLISWSNEGSEEIQTKAFLEVLQQYNHMQPLKSNQQHYTSE